MLYLYRGGISFNTGGSISTSDVEIEPPVLKEMEIEPPVLKEIPPPAIGWDSGEWSGGQGVRVGRGEGGA